MISVPSVFSNYNGVVFPGYQAKNATGAGATDGTEFIAALIDNYMWGWQHALLSYAGLSPNGVTESATSSQIIQALYLVLSPPGTIVEWNLNADPASFGARFLLLNGQGILRANYVDLDTNVYVGDGDNATAPAYYRATDSGGTSRSTTGAYLILPESRGYFARGLDTAATIDPDGASRAIGHLQDFALQWHEHGLDSNVNNGFVVGSAAIAITATAANITDASFMNTGAFTSGAYGTVKRAVETRPANRATKYAIRY